MDYKSIYSRHSDYKSEWTEDYKSEWTEIRMDGRASFRFASLPAIVHCSLFIVHCSSFIVHCSLFILKIHEISKVGHIPFNRQAVSLHSLSKLNY